MNAADYLSKFLNYEKADVKCAFIKHEWSNGVIDLHYLKTGYSSADWLNFFRSLDFEFDNRRRGKVSGIIWLDDGTWYEQSDLDLNAWQHKKVPVIPDACL